jgi:hypothetical protein
MGPCRQQGKNTAKYPEIMLRISYQVKFKNGAENVQSFSSQVPGRKDHSSRSPPDAEWIEAT